MKMSKRNLIFWVSLTLYLVGSSYGFISNEASARRTKFISLFADWKSIYRAQESQHSVTDPGQWQALIDSLREKWRERRKEIYEALGAERYLDLLTSYLKTGSALDKVRALWEMRYIYFDMVEGPLQDLDENKKKQLREKILTNLIKSMENIEGDFELWYNAKEVLTEMLQDSSYHTGQYQIEVNGRLISPVEKNDPQIKNPREEVWKPALIVSLKALGNPKYQRKPWVLDCITEAIIPVRIKNNQKFYELLLDLMNLNSSAWKDLSLDGLTPKEKENIRRNLARYVLGEMLLVYKNAVGKTDLYRALRTRLFNAFKAEDNVEISKYLGKALTQLRDKDLVGDLINVYDNTTNTEKRKQIIEILSLINYEDDATLVEKVKGKLIDIIGNETELELQEEAKKALETLVNGGFIPRDAVAQYLPSVPTQAVQMKPDQIGKFGKQVKAEIKGDELVMHIGDKVAVYKKVGPFSGMHSIPIYEYQLVTDKSTTEFTPVDEFGRPLPEKILLKGGSNLLALHEYLGSRFYARMGIPVPRMALVNDNGKLKVAIEFLEGYEGGSLFLPEQYHNSPVIQKGIFVSTLISDRDATPWNMMFKKEDVPGPGFYRIDMNGLLTRPTGRMVEFGGKIGVADFNRVTTMVRHQQSLPVNEAYQKVKENLRLLYERAEEFSRALTPNVITEIVNSVFDEVNAVFGEDKLNEEIYNHWLSLLQAELPYWHRKNAWDHCGAIRALQAVSTRGLRNYYIQALIARRNELERLFVTPGNIERSQAFTTIVSNKDYRVVSIDQAGDVVIYGLKYGAGLNQDATIFVFTTDNAVVGTDISWSNIKSQIAEIRRIKPRELKIKEIIMKSNDEIQINTDYGEYILNLNTKEILPFQQTSYVVSKEALLV